MRATRNEPTNAAPTSTSGRWAAVGSLSAPGMPATAAAGDVWCGARLLAHGRLLALPLGLLVQALGLLELLALLAGELLGLLGRLLGPLLGLRALLLGAPRVRQRDVLAQLRAAGLGRRLVGILAHSGGSSPKARRQITAASLVVAIEASAPSAASRPDHTSRLTISLSMAAESMTGTDAQASRPSQIVSTT